MRTELSRTEGGASRMARAADAASGRYGGAIEQCRRMLESVGVELGGARPYDLRVNDPAVFRAAVRGDTLALGEAYVRGGWDCERLDELIARLARLEVPLSFGLVWENLKARISDGGSRPAARKVAERHYDLGNDLFEAMLDPRLVYSCGYWVTAETLEEAQLAKLDLICRKLGLRPGMRFLDIGGGWGALAIHAAERYGVEALTITISKEQYELARERAKGLPVEVRLQDYRDLEGEFDRIASVGMFEHVGKKHHREYMRIAHRLLRPDGLFLLHTIGANRRSDSTDPWIDRYIFPGGHIPALVELAVAIEGLFVMEDWHNFGAYYDRTLMAWFERFSKNWEELAPRYGETFYRRWKLYLLGCAGAFRSRQLQLWQVVLSPRGVPGGYRGAR